MQIETGDYFCITKGFEYHPITLFGDMFGNSKRDDKPRYDRSFEGLVFEAMEVCYPVVAAKVIYGESYKEKEIGKVYSLNLTEIEIMTVTERYIKSLSVKIKVSKKS